MPSTSSAHELKRQVARRRHEARQAAPPTFKLSCGQNLLLRTNLRITHTHTRFHGRVFDIDIAALCDLRPTSNVLLFWRLRLGGDAGRRPDCTVTAFSLSLSLSLSFGILRSVAVAVATGWSIVYCVLCIVYHSERECVMVRRKYEGGEGELDAEAIELCIWRRTQSESRQVRATTSRQYLFASAQRQRPRPRPHNEGSSSN